MSKGSRKVIANNKKAFHDYFVEERYEAGIVLTGTEIKSVRKGGVSIKESYAKITSKGELVVTGMHIAPYEQGNRFNVDPLRVRTLLMHRKEINKLYGTLKTQQGLTLIPLSVYLDENGRCKVEVGLCRGKKNYDKREAEAKRSADRKIDKAIKESRNR
ncbi:MAG: SsrA-binding protein SmpB [Mogibacterium sp.]|nr:SsrA-binding protein SmpB [Mogibacterium sp.]MBR2539443.1 SsrA-binding protein SmpB [Mogibacterium sp.]